MPEVSLTLRTPAAIGDLPGTGFVRPSLKHIPGSVLRGAVAAVWLRAGRAVDDTFLSAFERDVAWGPLYLPGSEPQPLSHWVHRYEGRQDCPAFWDEASEEVPAGRRCPECGDPVELSKGQMRGVARSLDTHVQLANGRAVDGALFARERIDRGQTFVGSVQPLNDQGAASLEVVWRTVGCDGANSTGRVWVGGRRSTDGGRADLQVKRESDEADPIANGRLVVRLLSPGIFVDDFGFPAREPRADEISEVLGVQAEVERSWVRWTTIGGWHAAAKLPKPAERAVSAGSVFQISCDAEPDPGHVRALLKRGLGLRRVEGYGALSSMPEKPRTAKEITQKVIGLRGLPTGSRNMVRKEIDTAESAVRQGGQPNWPYVRGLAGGDKVPEHFRQAASFIMALTSAEELAAAGKAIRENR